MNLKLEYNLVVIIQKHLITESETSTRAIISKMINISVGGLRPYRTRWL